MFFTWNPNQVQRSRSNTFWREFYSFTLYGVCAAPSGLIFAPFRSENGDTLCLCWSSLRGRRKKGRGRGREKSTNSIKISLLSPTPLFFSLFPYPLPLSTPATQANVDLESGMVFEGTTEVYKRIYRFNSKWVRKKKQYWNEFEEFLVCSLTRLSSDNIISA